MVWKPGEQIDTNLIIGFLWSGKIIPISSLFAVRPEGETWSVIVNE